MVAEPNAPVYHTSRLKVIGLARKVSVYIYIYTYTQYRHVEREASLAISLTQIVWIPGKPPGTHACIMLMLVLCSKQYFPCPWHKQVLKVSKN